MWHQSCIRCCEMSCRSPQTPNHLWQQVGGGSPWQQPAVSVLVRDAGGWRGGAALRASDTRPCERRCDHACARARRVRTAPPGQLTASAACHLIRKRRRGRARCGSLLVLYLFFARVCTSGSPDKGLDDGFPSFSPNERCQTAELGLLQSGGCHARVPMSSRPSQASTPVPP